MEYYTEVMQMVSSSDFQAILWVMVCLDPCYFLFIILKMSNDFADKTEMRVRGIDAILLGTEASINRTYLILKVIQSTNLRQ